jgi:hypothetical protein
MLFSWGLGAASVLAFGHMNFDAIELGAHDDLAGQSGGTTALVGEFENIVLIFLHDGQAFSPRCRYEHVASGASALAATITIDARHGVVGGGAHQVFANVGLNAAASAVKADEMDLGHGEKIFLENRNSGMS